MRLNLLFIVMDLLTLLAYPIVFVHGKLRPFAKAKAGIPLASMLVPLPILVERRPPYYRKDTGL